MPAPDTWLNGVLSSEAAEWWPMCAPLLEKALTRTGACEDYSTDDLLELVQNREMQLWVMHDGDAILAAFLTQIMVFPRRKVLGIPFLGAKRGTYKRWLGHLDSVKEFAREHGCAAIRGWGRRGWEKRLNPYKVLAEFDVEV
jgi:hypothetical protein